MNISNEDKITLLEFLSCKMVGEVDKNHLETDEYGAKIYETPIGERVLICNFDPYNMKILLKTLDIIENKHDCKTILGGGKDNYFFQIRTKTTSYPDMVLYKTREEAIFKAVLDYIKLLHKNDLETIN